MPRPHSGPTRAAASLCEGHQGAHLRPATPGRPAAPVDVHRTGRGSTTSGACEPGDDTAADVSPTGPRHAAPNVLQRRRLMPRRLSAGHRVRRPQPDARSSTCRPTFPPPGRHSSCHRDPLNLRVIRQHVRVSGQPHRLLLHPGYRAPMGLVLVLALVSSAPSARWSLVHRRRQVSRRAPTTLWSCCSSFACSGSSPRVATRPRSKMRLRPRGSTLTPQSAAPRRSTASTRPTPRARRGDAPLTSSSTPSSDSDSGSATRTPATRGAGRRTRPRPTHLRPCLEPVRQDQAPRPAPRRPATEWSRRDAARPHRHTPPLGLSDQLHLVPAPVATRIRAVRAIAPRPPTRACGPRLA